MCVRHESCSLMFAGTFPADKYRNVITRRSSADIGFRIGVTLVILSLINEKKMVKAFFGHSNVLKMKFTVTIPECLVQMKIFAMQFSFPENSSPQIFSAVSFYKFVFFYEHLIQQSLRIAIFDCVGSTC